MTENEAMDLNKLITDAKALAKEKDTLARTFRGFRDYGNPISTITSGAEKAQKEAEQYEQVAKLFEELKQYRAIGTVEEIQKKLEELERWRTDRINENIQNPFAYTSTSICHNCDHKDEYIEELETQLDEFKTLKEKSEPKKTNSFSGCVYNNVEQD